MLGACLPVVEILKKQGERDRGKNYSNGFKGFPLQCGSHLPQYARWNYLPSHPPSRNSLNFKLDQVGKSRLPTVNCKLDQYNTYGQNERSFKMNTFLMD